MKLGEKIRQIRRKTGLTQNDLADRSGVSFRAIQRIEDGSGNARLDTLTAIAQALETPVAELIDERPRPSNNEPSGPTGAEVSELVRAFLEATPENRRVAQDALSGKAAAAGAEHPEHRQLREWFLKIERNFGPGSMKQLADLVNVVAIARVTQELRDEPYANSKKAVRPESTPEAQPLKHRKPGAG